MSQEDVEIVERFLEALDRREYHRATPLLHEDAEWHNTAAFPGPQTITGPKAMVEFWEALLESFDPIEGAVESITARGDRVVVGVHSHGRGAGSGVPIDVRYALTFSLCGNRIARVEVSGDYAKALKAVGLRE
jgi:ketosteroid isomerase-like protein